MGDIHINLVDIALLHNLLDFAISAQAPSQVFGSINSSCSQA